MREGFVNFLGVCEFGFGRVSLREFLLNFCEKIQSFYGFKVKTHAFLLKNSKNLRELFVAFLAVNLFKIWLNFCKKIQGFFEFKVKNSQILRLFCFEFFKQFKQGYEFKRKIHAFTRIKNV